MPHLGKRLALATAIAVAASLLCSAVLADSQSGAKKHFDNGTQMMELEDFSGAAREFQASLSLYRTSSALFNLAMCQKAMHRYPEALDNFRALLSEFGPQLTADTRKEVDGNIATLSKIIAEVEITVNASNASVHLDGVFVGTTPLSDPVRVGAGHRRISVSKQGYATSERQIQIVAGTKEVILFDLQVEAASSPTMTTTTAPSAPSAAPAEYTQDNPDPEMLAVERALGKPMYRDYTRYQRSRASQKMGFVEYQYHHMKKERNKGIVLAAVATPIFLAVGATLNIVFHDLADERAPKDTLSLGPDERTVGWIIFAVFSAAATGTLIPGAIHWALGKKKMRTLKPVYNQYVKGIEPQVETDAEPEGAAAQDAPPESPAVEPKAQLKTHLGLIPVLDRNGVPSGAGLTLVF
jgi:hypothetical protein